MDDLPKIREIRRMEYPTEAYPKLFELQEKGTVIYRPRLAVVLPKEVPGGTTLGAEVCNSPPSNLARKQLVLGFWRFTDPVEQLKQAKTIIKQYEIEDAYSRLTLVEEDTLELFNHDMERVSERLSFQRPTRSDDMGHIHPHATQARELIRNKRVLFPEGCELQKLLTDIPAADPDIVDRDYPAEASALYLIASLYYLSTYEPNPGGRKKKPYEPWARLENLDVNKLHQEWEKKQR